MCFKMIKVVPYSGVSEETLEAFKPLGEAVVAHAASKKFKVRTAVFMVTGRTSNKQYSDLEEVVATQVEGTPAMLKKVAKSKGVSFVAGKTMADPKGCETMCCYLCPWICGCTEHMAVQGAVYIEIPGIAGKAVFVVTGSPTGSEDQANATVPACAHKCAATPDCVAFELYLPPSSAPTTEMNTQTDTGACYIFLKDMEPPFTSNQNALTCVRRVGAVGHGGDRVKTS